MIGFRVQHKDSGLGAYHNYTFHQPNWNIKMCKEHGENRNKWPVIPIIVCGKNCRSACKTLKQLHDWFDGYWSNLLSEGFYIVKISGKLVFEDEKQIVLKDIKILKYIT